MIHCPMGGDALGVQAGQIVLDRSDPGVELAETQIGAGGEIVLCVGKRVERIAGRVLAWVPAMEP